jgi:hypothetical protein
MIRSLGAGEACFKSDDSSQGPAVFANKLTFCRLKDGASHAAHLRWLHVISDNMQSEPHHNVFVCD